jgi:hypothetical protein
MEPRPEGRNPRRGRGQERIDRQQSGKTGLVARTLRVCNASEPRRRSARWNFGSTRQDGEERHGGEVVLRGTPTLGEGKPLKAQSPRALPARNKAGRREAEQSVKRLREPEGAAQPG